MNARAVVLAAGKGTRMRSQRPKVLHEICGRPMLWWVLAALRSSGVDAIVVVSNAELDPLLAPFGVQTVIQREQLGTGHAVRVALDTMTPASGTLIVAYGDMPLVDPAIFTDVLAAATRDDATALALVTARMPLPSSFGRIIRGTNAAGTATVERIVEAKDCTAQQLTVDEMNAGIYAYDEPALRTAIARVGNENAQGEYYLTDTVELLLGAGRAVVPVGVADYRSVLGVNDRVELAAANAVVNARLCEHHMRAGVTIIDPLTTQLEPGIVIGADSIIHPGCAIGGTTVIGDDACIGPHVRLRNATLGAAVRVTESVITDSVVGDRTTVGPFAHLRGGNRIGDDVRIGNFVEMKKSSLDNGTKAGHLAYVGDAIVGKGVNISAGVITCNYDGVRKHTTTIGDDAFIGTNNSLVAPVTIGTGAQTGAGTVVIRDVPPGDKVVGVPGRSILKRAAAADA